MPGTAHGMPVTSLFGQDQSITGLITSSGISVTADIRSINEADEPGPGKVITW